MASSRLSKRLIDTFHGVIPDDPRSTVRQMFGCPCCFAQGNMFLGAHGKTLFLRLSEEDREALLAIPGAGRFEPSAGRPMREYVCVPPAMLSDGEALSDWVARSFDFALTLEPRLPKRRTKVGKKMHSSARPLSAKAPPAPHAPESAEAKTPPAKRAVRKTSTRKKTARKISARKGD